MEAAIEHPEFKVHILNDDGIQKAKDIAALFNELLTKIGKLCPPGREFSIVKTKLEEASFFAKKSMAQFEVNQKS
jgi:hypothetical protein